MAVFKNGRWWGRPTAEDKARGYPLSPYRRPSKGAPVAILHQLHHAVAAELIKRIEAGDAQAFGLALSFLKQNGIVDPTPAEIPDHLADIHNRPARRRAAAA